MDSSLITADMAIRYIYAINKENAFNSKKTGMNAPAIIHSIKGIIAECCHIEHVML